MEKMSTLTFPDGSVYEVVDEEARAKANELNIAIEDVNANLTIEKVNLVDNDAVLTRIGSIRILDFLGNTQISKNTAIVPEADRPSNMVQVAAYCGVTNANGNTTWGLYTGMLETSGVVNFVALGSSILSSPYARCQFIWVVG